MYLRSATTTPELLSASWVEVASSTTSGVFPIGTDYCSKSGQDVVCGSNIIPASMKDANGDQYFQYKVELSTFGATSTTIEEIEITYVVNASPEFENAPTASQSSDGTVTINYSVRDGDTDEVNAATLGTVLPSFKYSLNNGSNWIDVTDTCLTLGATTSVAVEQVAYTASSTTWTPSCEVGISNSTYTTTAMIQVTVDDSEGANNTTASSSVAFILDTTPPVPSINPIIIDAKEASSTIANLTLSATDDSAKEMRIGLLADTTDGSWVTYSISATTTLASNPDTVYVEFRDVYGNTSSIFDVTTPETPQSVMI